MSTMQTSYFKPMARFDVAEQIRQQAHAAIDVSDGCIVDLMHVLKASAVGAELDSAAIPLAAGALMEDALYGGDDYELIVTAPGTLSGFVPFGTITAQTGCWLDGQPASEVGYRHFQP